MELSARLNSFQSVSFLMLQREEKENTAPDPREYPFFILISGLKYDCKKRYRVRAGEMEKTKWNVAAQIN
jgi:hypothetical protein